MNTPDEDYSTADVLLVRMWTPDQLRCYQRIGWHPPPDYMAPDGPRWRAATVNAFTEALARGCLKETMAEIARIAPDIDAAMAPSAAQPFDSLVDVLFAVHRDTGQRIDFKMFFAAVLVDEQLLSPARFAEVLSPARLGALAEILTSA